MEQVKLIKEKKISLETDMLGKSEYRGTKRVESAG
jgi:hypothetical protein